MFQSGADVVQHGYGGDTKMGRRKATYPTADRRIVVSDEVWELLAAVASVLGRTTADVAQDAMTQGAARLFSHYERYWHRNGGLPGVTANPTADAEPQGKGASA